MFTGRRREALQARWQPLVRKYWKTVAWIGLGVLLPLVLVANVTEEVFRDGGFVWDQAILDFYRENRTPALTAFAQALGVIGGVTVLPIITLALALALAWKRLPGKAWYLALSVAGGTLLNVLAKIAFQRPRPDGLGAVLVEPGFSFPSGHTMANSAFAVALILIFWPTRARWAVLGLAGAWMLLIAASRNYLGVHYPTDVLVGMLASTAWAAGLYRAMRRVWVRPREAARQAKREQAQEDAGNGDGDRLKVP